METFYVTFGPDHLTGGPLGNIPERRFLQITAMDMDAAQRIAYALTGGDYAFTYTIDTLRTDLYDGPFMTIRCRDLRGVL